MRALNHAVIFDGVIRRSIIVLTVGFAVARSGTPSLTLTGSCDTLVNAGF